MWGATCVYPSISNSTTQFLPPSTLYLYLFSSQRTLPLWSHQSLAQHKGKGHEWPKEPKPHMCLRLALPPITQLPTASRPLRNTGLNCAGNWAVKAKGKNLRVSGPAESTPGSFKGQMYLFALVHISLSLTHTHTHTQQLQNNQVNILIALMTAENSSIFCFCSRPRPRRSFLNRCVTATWPGFRATTHNADYPHCHVDVILQVNTYSMFTASSPVDVSLIIWCLKFIF